MKISFRKIEASDLEKVVKIHSSSLHMGILPHFGTDFLLRMYSAIIQKDLNFGYVAVVDNKVVGFIIATVEEISLIRCLNLFSASIFFLNCILKPSLFFSAIKVFLNTKKNKARVTADIEISQLAIDEKFRSFLIGLDLISLIEQKALENGFKTIFSRTHNEGLIRYYYRKKNAVRIDKFYESKISYSTLKWNL